jgi:predicted NBD/HSP70 family sugar kinase
MVMAVANRDLMRAINRFTILHAIRDSGDISRVDLSRKTGVSQATVTSIIAELIGEGVLIERQRGKSRGGRRPVLLALNPKGAFAVGVHLSVDHISVVLMDFQANIISEHTRPLLTGNHDPEQVMETVIEAVHTCLWDADFSKSQVSGIGIAVPGLVDSGTGYVHFVPNYQWKDVNFAKRLRKRIGVATYIENSANTLAIYEQWFGFGRGTDNFILITTEHGIGMGMILNGKIFRGLRGISGEIGHTIVSENGELCRCGESGCLEAICGNNAIIRDAKKAVKNGEWQVKDIDSVTIDKIIDAAQAGNQALIKIYDRAGRTLGTGIRNLNKIFDVEKIIISGKGVLAGDLLFKPMQKTLSKDISFAEDAVTRLFIQPWQPTNYARAAGALVLQEIYQSPANRVVPII